MDDQEPLLTRKQLAKAIRDELGIPIGDSALDKAAMRGTGPEPAAKYGRTFLYRREAGLKWARTLITSIAI